MVGPIAPTPVRPGSAATCSRSNTESPPVCSSRATLTSTAASIRRTTSCGAKDLVRPTPRPTTTCGGRISVRERPARGRRWPLSLLRRSRKVLPSPSSRLSSYLAYLLAAAVMQFTLLLGRIHNLCLMTGTANHERHQSMQSAAIPPKSTAVGYYRRRHHPHWENYARSHPHHTHRDGRAVLGG